MADEEAEQDRCAHSIASAAIVCLRERLRDLATALRDSEDAPEQSASRYCHDFCQTLVEYAGRWRIEQDPLPLVEVYTVALLSYAHAAPCLSSQCENVSLVLERLTLSCVELLLSLPEHVPDALWEDFQSSVRSAHGLLQENGLSQLRMLHVVAQERGVWSHDTLRAILAKETCDTEKVHEFLALEGPVLLEMRTKHLIKENQAEKAALLAKACSEYPGLEGKGHFKQTYLVCLCTTAAQDPLMQELSKVDCRDAVEMICNLESDGDEKGALCLCSAFLTRQLLQGDMYCAWELTLFWSKLLKRLESSAQAFLDRCRQMSSLSKTVYHILFLIKVIQSEMEEVGLPVCVELCIRALQMESDDSRNTKATICKTISCLLPSDLEVKRACQLTEFLLEPTVDSYYAVETLYNEPDQKLEEESLPVANSLRCELLLVFKTHWPFDPEFWDWKTLKRHCLALMGEEASIVSSIDELNDSENPEGADDDELIKGHEVYKDQAESFWDTTNELNEMEDERKKKREIKKLREKGFISARFRNWQAYMQYCVLCDKEFLGHRIVRHAQTHVKDGIYSCPICAETFDLKDVLVPHVASHVKQSCKERLAAMKTSKKLANSSKAAVPDCAAEKVAEKHDRKPKVPNCEYFQDPNVGDNPEAFVAKTEFSALRADSAEEYSCPVVNCRKGFKYFRNLIAHVKAHRNNDEAKRFLEMQSKKVVCQYCRRQFVSVTHLNDHLQVHCGVRPYICIQLSCKASFLSNAELLVHRKEHAAFKAMCMFPSCGRVFHEAYMLYDHEAQHYNTFTCKAPACGKIFHTQPQLDLHQEEHVSKGGEHPTSSQGQAHFEIKTEPSGSLVESNHSAYDAMAELPGDQDFHLQGLIEQSASNSADEAAAYLLGPVKVKHSVESMLNPGQGLMQEFEHDISFKTELPDDDDDDEQQLFPLPCPDDSGVRSSAAARPADPVEPGFGSSSVCSLLRDPRNAAAPSQGPAHPPLAPHACVMQGAPAAAVLKRATGPGPGEKERHNCAFETCTRNYSSYRSVTKHMKAAHPDFYVEWKLAKRNNKVLKPTARSLSTGVKLNSVAQSQDKIRSGVPLPVAQTANVAGQPMLYATSGLNPAVPNQSFSTHSAAVADFTANISPVAAPQMDITNRACSATLSHPVRSWHQVSRD
ncbi:hypothetical protein AAFF_G00120500 [Aldrovandia affinis]|uniref:C2H2-type domain-containing protein n=1 Tax=Aldrovandia affinis TaxID=143900 RepID=A0AAD7RS65_9TELE|nr:hypothetical protein AAFF_G00120500 [Aldrovandia affinis]